MSDHLDNSSQVDVIYTDLSKAFDHIDHNRLLNKLYSFNFSPNLVTLFSSYFRGRSQFVANKANKSQIFHVSSGVPQGSVLGPLLFNLLIDDLASELTVCRLLYADDVKLYHPVSTANDCVRLQHDLDILSAWCRQNRLTLNISKCAVLSFHRIKNPVPYNYTINGASLNRLTSIVDLGIVFDSRLSFSSHIESLCSKCYRCLGVIVRNGRDLSPNTLMRLFNFCAVQT